MKGEEKDIYIFIAGSARTSSSGWISVTRRL